ncbi:hypothetical protein [Bacillus chungangensis]|uniref:Uncharacterized protein n=1 Tax=Bacillus chungangensis TaxID=587633 RepID=A0ABT9WQF5_9BACI|nr:hypothetical protein [Bacillus chungangensis]MDQ0175452.1 hypothetical protein [Bacillus chungangensis]
MRKSKTNSTSLGVAITNWEHHPDVRFNEVDSIPVESSYLDLFDRNEVFITIEE